MSIRDSIAFIDPDSLGDASFAFPQKLVNLG
jgi:hypothetical protein